MNGMQNRLPLFLLSVIFFISAFSAQAQNDANAAKKIYDKAIIAIDNRNYEESIQLLNTSLLKDSNFIYSYLTLFQLYLDLKKNDKAISIFEKGLNKDSSAFLPYYVKYASAYASMGNYQKAFEIVNPIRNNAPAYLKQKALDLLQICTFAIQHPVDTIIKVTNVGDSINTAAAEYFPTVTVQDSLFLFMRRNSYKREDFYYSTITPNGFTKAQPLSDSLNLADKKGSPSLSSDLQTLYYAADYAERGYGRYDIYKVEKTKTGWSLPKNLGQNINSDFWESAPSISPDGQALYFCSNIPGGYGGIDIYVAYKNENGAWGEAQNLGPNINTAGDEQTPFIHADNKTLYFASSGWPGYGGSDLFMSRKKIDGSWSKPINLGYPINTIDNEGSIAVASDGAEGYIASDRIDSRGGLDIYKVILSHNTRANKTYYLKGIINEAGTLNALAGTVRLVDPSDTSSYMQVDVNKSGHFVLALPYFDSLGIQVNSPNHEFASMLLTADSVARLAGNTLCFSLASIEKQFTKNFKNVFFEINSAQLMPSSNVELNALVTYLMNTPNAHILIEGHTDNTGNNAANLTLSSNRAQAIAQYLINKGITKNRISTKGYGASKPISDNITQSGRAQNRRTNFTISLL
jgi:outer membrane protein OmpA-like peptidoglycan-associated protein/tetratricopeptide (TPR) repeat protein